MKVVVARYEDGEPIYNTRFLAFATHYGFRPVACRPRRPQTKGKVERPFLYIEKNLLSGREFRSLEHLNEVAAWWLAEVADVREHRQTRRRPIDLHAEELPHLIPLPERPYEVAEMVYRTVDAEGFISYGNNRYSVPWHYLGQVLPVRITDEAVTIYSPRLELLARHVRFPATERHRQSRQPEHLPPRDLARRREVLRGRFAELGAVGGAVPGGPAQLRNAVAGTMPRRCWRCWAFIAARTCWPPWSVPCVTGRSRRNPSSASWRCRPDPRPAGTAWRKKNRLTWGNCCPTTLRRRDPRRNTNTCCSRSPTTMTNRRKRRHRPGRPRRTFLRIFVSGSWTTPRRSRFPCPPRCSTRRWPVPTRRGCPT